MLDARARVRRRGVLDHERGHHVARLVGRQLGEEGRGRSRRKPLQRLDDFPQGGMHDVADLEQWQEDRARLDRKSTRLNSSHGYISYAVFCLKKKNKKSTRCTYIRA